MAILARVILITIIFHSKFLYAQTSSLQSEIELLSKTYDVKASTKIAIKCYSVSYMLGAYANDNSMMLQKMGLGSKLIETSDAFAKHMIKHMKEVAESEDELLKLTEKSLSYYDAISKTIRKEKINILDSLLLNDYYACQRNKDIILKNH